MSTPLDGASAFVVRAGLSYAAWTQIIPAVLVWMFAIMMLTALWLVGMDARGENPAAGLQSLAERFPGLSSSMDAWYQARVAPSIAAATDPDTGAVHFDKIDFLGVATWVWFWLSLAGMLLGALWRLLFGPLPSRQLGQKLLMVLGACAVLVVLMFFVLSRLPPSFEGDLLSWFGIASSVGLMVLCFTSWSVVCAHGLGKVADAVAPGKDV